MAKKRILLVEKTEGLPKLWEEQLKGTRIEIYTAKNLGELDALFSMHGGDFDLMVIGNEKFEIGRKVEHVIATMRGKGYDGYILIGTTIADAHKRQLRAGGANTITVRKRHNIVSVIKALLAPEE